MWQTGAVAQALYVYAIARAHHPMPAQIEAIDGSDHIASVETDDLSAFYTSVDAADFSQPLIDARSKDVEWLGAIGYRHQAVMNALIREHERFVRILDRLDGKQEWTLRIEFRPEQWNEALTRRVESLQKLTTEISGAASGKAYLLRKKFDEEKK